MSEMIAARDALLDELRRELVGPSPEGKPIDCTDSLTFGTFEAAEGPFRQKDSGEEILTGDRPFKRYGIAVLYPGMMAVEAEPATTETEESRLEQLADEEPNVDSGDVVPATAGRVRAGQAEDDDLPLSTANAMRPSSLGLSFIVAAPSGSELLVSFRGAQYLPKEVTIKERDSRRTWWLRRPFEVSAAFSAAALTSKRAVLKPSRLDGSFPEGLSIEILAVARPMGEGQSLVTVSAVNRTPDSGIADTHAVFQVELECEMSEEPAATILPYEERERVADDPELASLALIYRDVPAFAVGHGCAADWDAEEGAHEARQVRAAPFPQVEVPSTTPDIIGSDGESVVVPMAPLAGLDEGDDGSASLQSIVDGYSAWIAEQAERAAELTDDKHRATALDHLRLCREMCDRMEDGIAFLAEDPKAALAFRFANQAMLLQQQRSGQPVRKTTFNRDSLRIAVEGTFEPRVKGRGSWRPFQIAFVLATLRSTANKGDEERETVELIFFPTGGGKTEAYLGLTAFSIFYRRLLDPEDVGVDVLMRYTLRLLTAQQFQRASSLICAMERIRADRAAELGDSEIAIGVWLGGTVTPNSRRDAVQALKKLKKEGEGGDNPFVLLRCPWCSAQMGPIGTSGKGKGRGRGPEPKVAGYEVREDAVILRCPDSTCDFNSSLPVYVVDQDVYAYRPSLVIGTVDKFAMLALRPEARALFGIASDGQRGASPPNLIIQDELHLISGPLGSMVGLYETVIEELCSDRRSGLSRPKIVGSTATIRRYEQQIKDLYCRERSALFPPRGIDAGNSYFARYARDDDGELLPGRIYVGVYGAGLGSIQTAQVRTFAALAQSVGDMADELQDPWWTLLVFFNSLRELGTSLSLLQSDIPDYLRVLQKRHGRRSEDVRRLWRVEELTGRLRNDEVPRAIEKLEVRVTDEGDRAVDVCLASNIVEVGVDIDRLSLMTVVGQPKTTAQYIQATGRVGRNWRERPGLVATIYGASKPRDRSHFERFRAYHERLYAQVEPTSVTPFAPPVLDRALHAVLVAYVRQLSEVKATPFPVPDELIESAFELLKSRVERVDPEELVRFEEAFKTSVRQWRKWEYTDWLPDSDSEDYALLRYAGDYADKEARHLSWSIPTSLRNVDFECRAEITKAYIKDVEGTT